MKKITKIEPAAATKKKKKRRVAAYCWVNRFLGYDKDEEGKLIINPKETEVVQAIREVCLKPDAYLLQLKTNIEKMLGHDNSGLGAELDGKITELEQQILQRTRKRQDCDDLEQEVIRLWEEKYKLQLEDATKESTRQKIAELEKDIAETSVENLDYDETLVRRLIECITVYDEKFVVEFKSGIEIDVRL